MRHNIEHWPLYLKRPQPEISLLFIVHPSKKYRSQIKSRLKSGVQKSEIQTLCKSSTSLYITMFYSSTYPEVQYCSSSLQKNPSLRQCIKVQCIVH